MAAPNLTALVSVQAGSERQGEILGINQSMQSVGQMLPAVAAGYLNTLDVSLPMMASAGLVLLAWVVLVGVFLRGET